MGEEEGSKMTFMKDALKHRTGSVLVSVVLGLGLATVFQKVCKENCVVVQAPGLAHVTEHVWSVDDTCYKYTPETVECKDNVAVMANASIVEPFPARPSLEHRRG